jgi:hypothetical protein
MVGSEDRPERGGDDVEVAVRERERLGVCLDPPELHAMSLGFSGVRSEATTLFAVILALVGAGDCSDCSSFTGRRSMDLISI